MRQLAEVLHGISQKQGHWLEKRFFEKSLHVAISAEQEPTLFVRFPNEPKTSDYAEEAFGKAMTEFMLPLLSQPKEVISFYVKTGESRYSPVANKDAIDQSGVTGFQIRMKDFNLAAQGDLRAAFYPGGNWVQFDKENAGRAA